MIDEALNLLESKGFILDEDVAWIGVTSQHLQHIAGVHFTCPVRNVECVEYRGVEFRFSPWAKPEHRIHPVWNITGRTKKLLFRTDTKNED